MDTQPSAAPNAVQAAPARPKLLDRRGRVYEPAISPRLKVLLLVIFAGVAILGASGAYLISIRFLEWFRAPRTYQNQFSLWMFAAHAVLGALLVLPFLSFGALHLASAIKRPNRLAVRLGIFLFLSGIVVCFTGLALFQLEGLPQLPTSSISRWIVYALHVLAPIAAVVLYVQHRRAGPDIKWRWGYAWVGGVAAFIAVMIVMHSQDPRKWYQRGSVEGEAYYEPARSRTFTGNFIPESALMMDEYCLKCHSDIYKSHLHSAHKFSTFNNPAYLFSVRETREVALKRDGDKRASRWCAGCHDPVPFFSGTFEDPRQDPRFDPVRDADRLRKYEEVEEVLAGKRDPQTHPISNAGITCVVCHGIVNVNSRVGNGDYTIDEPLHYPLAYSTNPVAQWFNNQLVKAKPEFHKKTFLKDFHRREDFCSTCHKVSIPGQVNFYKEWLRGQNHNDSFLLSGVSGHGARSFYYPKVAQKNCNNCHMPLVPSNDFGAKDFDGSGIRKIHSHIFIGANNGVHYLTRNPDREEIAKAHEGFLKDKQLRIDLFAVKKGDSVESEPLVVRPNLPKLEPGKSYLVEVVIRTLTVGHHFTQGTVDSNEVWVEFLAKSGGKVIGRSGAIDKDGQVDEWSHFLNVLMLDRNGNRIDRRNPQDIFTPLYDHQIPPGAGQVVHYKLDVPRDVTGPVELSVKLRYRKFDYAYMKLVHKGGPVPVLPVVDICQDTVTLPVAGVAEKVPEQMSPIQPAWQRWNDYGIGCFLEGGAGSKKGELKQAEAAFREVAAVDNKEAQFHGHLNRARVLIDEGALEEAVQELTKARAADPETWWNVAWFTGLVDAQNGHLDKAIATFEKVLDPANQPKARGFDFTKDYVVINELGKTLFLRAQQAEDLSERDSFLRRAVERYRQTLAIDPEDLDAHFGIARCYDLLGLKAPGAAADPKERAKFGEGPPAPAEPEKLMELAETLADGKAPRQERLEAATELAGGIEAHGEAPFQPKQPKAPTFRALLEKCRPVANSENDGELRAAANRVLGRVHRQLHGIYKIDENAKDQAVRIYRANHPAANAAAEAIVIYPTNR